MVRHSLVVVPPPLRLPGRPGQQMASLLAGCGKRLPAEQPPSKRFSERPGMQESPACSPLPNGTRAREKRRERHQELLPGSQEKLRAEITANSTWELVS